MVQHQCADRPAIHPVIRFPSVSKSFKGRDGQRAIDVLSPEAGRAA
jgi:hypothetical protein